MTCFYATEYGKVMQHYSGDYILLNRTPSCQQTQILLPALKKHAFRKYVDMLENPIWQGSVSSLQERREASSKNLKSSVLQLQEMYSHNNLRELERGLSPVEVLMRSQFQLTPALQSDKTLKQRTRVCQAQTSDLQKLCF